MVLVGDGAHHGADVEALLALGVRLQREDVAHGPEVAVRRVMGWLPTSRSMGSMLCARRILSGDELLAIAGPTLSFAYEPPARMTSEQRALLGPFFQSCQDWGEAHGDIGP